MTLLLTSYPKNDYFAGMAMVLLDKLIKKYYSYYVPLWKRFTQVILETFQFIVASGLEHPAKGYHPWDAAPDTETKIIYFKEKESCAEAVF